LLGPAGLELKHAGEGTKLESVELNNNDLPDLENLEEKLEETKGMRKKLQDAEDELLAEPIDDDQFFNDTKTLENLDWKAISIKYLKYQYG